MNGAEETYLIGPTRNHCVDKNLFLKSYPFDLESADRAIGG